MLVWGCEMRFHNIHLHDKTQVANFGSGPECVPWGPCAGSSCFTKERGTPGSPALTHLPTATSVDCRGTASGNYLTAVLPVPQGPYWP